MRTLDQLITAVNIQPFSPSIHYHDPLMLMGSCFASHMGEKLKRYKYNVLTNPFGIIYNPASMALSLDRITNGKHYDVSELVLHDGLYHSMDHHGSFSGTDQQMVVEKINQYLDDARSFLQKVKFVFISLGTSRVYRYKDSGKIAANNHKIPGVHFEPATLSIEEIQKDLASMARSILSMSPEARVIWTVSPIRHLRDGLVENQRSKAALITAIANFIAAHPETTYFPAYEIMMDQLRDYRYYARDLVHPSDVAIDIIWELFVQTYVSTDDASMHPAMEKIVKARNHRFIHENKSAIKSFAEAQLRSIDHLARLYPDMDWKEERQYFFHLIEPD